MNLKLVLLFTAFFLLSLSAFSQEKKNSNDVKTLVIIEGKHHLWTQQQKYDSINWTNVQSVDVMSDSLERVKKYGEKAKYGVMIVNYRNSTSRKDEKE